MTELREVRDAVLRAVALVVTDRRWAAPLSAMALGFGLFLGVAIGPGAAGTFATGAGSIVAIAAPEEGDGSEALEAAEPEAPTAEPEPEAFASEPETFERLTGTIVRQVGDLRRMVDEFSNFARMPKPVFRHENVYEIARQSLFLHEVAHPGVSFSLQPPEGRFDMVCDRRQLGQALSNVVKNAVEAIEARKSRGEHNLSGDRVDLKLREDEGQLIIDVLDTGVGLPEERERLTEPYMTTRVRGTGLGLAIVKKIVEEHLGEIAFLDRQGGGTHVRIAFDAHRLASLVSEDGAAASEDSDGGDERGPIGDGGVIDGA